MVCWDLEQGRRDEMRKVHMRTAGLREVTFSSGMGERSEGREL
jgi:hypothetical protein